MSPLTKLFVVLLVLVSTVLTAGVVTFVNKLDPIQQKLTAVTAERDTASALSQARQADLVAANAQLDDLRQGAQTEASKASNAVQAMRASVEKSDAQVVALNGQIAVLTSANARHAAALEASKSTSDKMADQIVALRKDADERLRQNADLGGRVSRLTAENDVLERTRRNLAEQVTELQSRVDRQARLLQDNGFTESQIAAAPAGVGRGAPAINGVIRSRRNIAGKEYATISIGSSDQVVKGMQFNILDSQTGAFLGVMTVDVVDANEAIGQIKAESNNLAQIKAGNVVRTQI